jgi:hypothetical protein
VSFAAITLCVAPQRVFIVVVYFVIDSVRKLLDTFLYTRQKGCTRFIVVSRSALFSEDAGFQFQSGGRLS